MTQCPNCKSEMIARERSSSVSGAGLVGAFIGVIGLLTLFANALLGIGIVIVGLLVGGMMRSKRLFLVCPGCKKEISVD